MITMKVLLCAALLLIASVFTASASRVFTVSLFQMGTNQHLLLNNKPVTIEGARAVLPKVAALDTNQLIVVSVHDGVPAQQLLLILRLLEDTGFLNVGVAFYDERGESSVGVVLRMKTDGAIFGNDLPLPKLPISDPMIKGLLKDSAIIDALMDIKSTKKGANKQIQPIAGKPGSG